MAVSSMALGSVETSSHNMVVTSGLFVMFSPMVGTTTPCLEAAASTPDAADGRGGDMADGWSSQSIVLDSDLCIPPPPPEAAAAEEESCSTCMMPLAGVGGLVRLSMLTSCAATAAVRGEMETGSWPGEGRLSVAGAEGLGDAPPSPPCYQV